jgi:phage-related holin
LVVAEMLVQAKDFTEHALVKAAVATGVVVSNSLAENVCRSLSGSDRCAVLGGIPDSLWLLIGMMLLDLATGILGAREAGERINSKDFGNGGRRKIGILVGVGAVFLLEQLFAQHGYPMEGNLILWGTTWFIASEAISLYENLERMGVKLPPFVKKAATWLLDRQSAKLAKVLPPAADAAPDKPEQTES